MRDCAGEVLDEIDPFELSEEEIAEAERLSKKAKCEPIPYVKKPINKIIAVIDTETDPFERGIIVAPFALGVELPDRYLDFIGDDCVDQFFAWLAVESLEGREYIFYAHNGGKFDFYFLFKYMDENQTPLIMGGRIVKMYFQGQEFRDSYAIIPESLESANKKTKISYRKFHRSVRHKHMAEIRAYLRDDCRYLYQLVIAFLNRFGDTLTIASAALRTLRSYHGFEQFRTEEMDARFRMYYYGGRNQCFETGKLKPSPGKTWKVWDRNGMYPAEMRDSLHPISNTVTLQDTIDDDTDFALIVANNRGALPSRSLNGGLDFTVPHGEFYATIHEIKAGLDTGTLDILEVKHAWAFTRKASFGAFVTDQMERRIREQEAGELIEEKNTKRVSNSSYGKFALNPRKFKQWTMTRGEWPEPRATGVNPNGWALHSQSGDMFIFSRPSPRKGGFYNVATAASITGAARANLLRAISVAHRPVYCDTDSIICESFGWSSQEGKALGQWKLEAEGDMCAIAGKKLYAVFFEEQAIKKAAKGVRFKRDEEDDYGITPQDIVSICNGSEIIHRNPVPTFKLDGRVLFTDRKIRMTGSNSLCG